MTYDEIFTFENLYKAHLKARLSKRNKREIIEFEMDTGCNISKLYYELKYRKYRISGYTTFYIHEPKERRVDALSYRDRIVQHCLCDNYFMPFLEKRLIYDNAATRIGKGTDFARGRLRHFYHDYYGKHKNNQGYVLKCDIHHFFECIDHDVLKNLLKKDIQDKDILSLMYGIIDSYESSPGKGLPIGNQTSQAFAIRYLDEMDRVIKEKFRIKHYIRYMDDFVLFSESSKYLQTVLEGIRLLLGMKYKLVLNAKTRICRMSESVEFLGFRFRFLQSGKILMKIDGKRRKRFAGKLNKNRVLLNKGKMDRKSYLSSFASYKGYIAKGNNHFFLKRLIYLYELF